tara:strand:+ start:102 stop:380 length:279 start_codon:yes stop_codon:yes gene_type:complete
MNDFENRIEDARKRENEMNNFTSMAQERRFEALKNELQTDEDFRLTAPEGEDSDEDSLGEQTTNQSIEIEVVDEWDGQPDEAQEWHDFDPDC